MGTKSDLSEAFDEALAATQRERSTGMTCADGSSAAGNLDQLERELVAERDRALERGKIDKEWFQRTIRWLVEWVPESELTLIAALGRIARVKPSEPA